MKKECCPGKLFMSVAFLLYFTSHEFKQAYNAFSFCFIWRDSREVGNHSHSSLFHFLGGQSRKENVERLRRFQTILMQCHTGHCWRCILSLQLQTLEIWFLIECDKVGNAKILWLVFSNFKWQTSKTFFQVYDKDVESVDFTSNSWRKVKMRANSQNWSQTWTLLEQNLTRKIESTFFDEQTE